MSRKRLRASRVANGGTAGWPAGRLACSARHPPRPYPSLCTSAPSMAAPVTTRQPRKHGEPDADRSLWMTGLKPRHPTRSSIATPHAIHLIPCLLGLTAMLWTLSLWGKPPQPDHPRALSLSLSPAIASCSRARACGAKWGWKRRLCGLGAVGDEDGSLRGEVSADSQRTLSGLSAMEMSNRERRLRRSRMAG